MYADKHVHIIQRRDLKAPARIKALSEVRLSDILISSMSTRMKEEAQLIVLKVSSMESVTLKDSFD